MELSAPATAHRRAIPRSQTQEYGVPHMSESFDPNFEAIVVRGMVPGPSGLVDKVVLLLDTGATTSVMKRTP